MKQSPKLRWFLVGLIHMLLYILGLPMFFICYPFAKLIIKHETPFLIWFLNTDEGDYVSNIYGDANYREKRNFNYEKSSIFRKIWEAFIWLVIRNSHYWFRLNVLFPKKGEIKNIKIFTNDTIPETGGLTFCNYSIWGKQHGEYDIEGFRYFRYSFTKRTPKLLRFVGFREMWNVHSGWTEHRWILKSRWFDV